MYEAEASDEKRVYTSTIIVQWMCRLRNECSFRLLLQTKLKLVFGVYLEFKVLWNSIILSWKCMVFFFCLLWCCLLTNLYIRVLYIIQPALRSVDAKDGLLHRWASSRRRTIAILQTEKRASHHTHFFFIFVLVNFHPKIHILPMLLF